MTKPNDAATVEGYARYRTTQLSSVTPFSRDRTADLGRRRISYLALSKGRRDEIFGCVRPLSLFYSAASADGVEERSLVPRSRSHARLRRNTTMSQAFSSVQPAFID
ncbi:hypothetical protein EVAR_81896_1 [Eumeta japonica]|uniref:Uncharacterized protein n=1 Tax=Eumeta variegata TaxID=151549 RepID=A0A4C1UYB1_EUMVA|nr:hypothetical protein EVAR_81896_1 [Eumeta japonica]